MSQEHVTITTNAGACPATVFTPAAESGAHPGAILYSDAFGIRPTIQNMGKRLADAGYVVLVPDLFYRAGEYQPMDPKKIMASGDMSAALGPIVGTTDNQTAATDSAAFLDYLHSREDVLQTPVGITGYCMGGAIALTVAGTYPDQIGAVGAFHAGSVVTDSEHSPHRVAPNIRGSVYIGGADHDDSFTPDDAQTLDQIFNDSGVPHTVTIFPEALHGYTMTDFPVYDEPAAERHWSELLGLFDSALARAA